jgi:two-component system CheB/CheR fusion protein
VARDRTRKRKGPPVPEPGGQAPTAASPDASPGDVGTSLEESGGHRFPVVGIGASAGGLEAFGELLKHLPRDTGMAYVFIQHLDPSHESMLAALLSRAAPMPIHEAQDGVEYAPNCAYVIPPNTYLAITDGILRLTPRPEIRGAPMPIDYFFRSLAEHVGSMSIGIVLSGTGSDGASGLVAIKARGGLTFAQDEQTATYNGMPRAAVHAGAVDRVLPPAGIARELARIARAPGTLGSGLAEESSGLVDGSTDLRRVLVMMKQATGADLGYYKAPTLLRRLARRMLLVNVPTLAAYVGYLRDHPAELTNLYDDILINVTSFFRDPEMLDGLSQYVFPALFNDRRPDMAIRVWVPGCSTGEEAYSIAIALWEHGENAAAHFPIQIFGTDLSDSAIARCRAGLYGEELGLSPERLARFFTKTPHGYQVNKSIRDVCIFAKHNLLEDPPFSHLDLISCRNLLIYVRSEYQRRVFELFHYALKPAGFLMLGRSETVSETAALFEAVSKPTRVYTKKPTTPRPIHFAPRLEPPSVGPGPAAAADPTRRLSEIVERADAALARHTPAAVVVDADAEILHYRGNTKLYLDPPSGPPTSNLLRTAREALQLDLRAALEAARKKNAGVRRGPIAMTDEGRERHVMVEVTPLSEREGDVRHFVVLFAEEVEHKTEHSPRAVRAAEDEPRPDDTEVARLRRELRDTRGQLEGSIHELESLNEEYHSAHEEALSANEELQSSNEELETAKEELQSANEELTTVNDELQDRSTELTDINNDLTNVLSSVHLPVLLVDRELRLRRFTPMATKVLNVIASDVGRPISDLAPNLPVPDLSALVLETMETMRPHERTVQDREGRWHAMRVRPYRTHEHKIDGAVIMLVDVDDLRSALAEARDAQEYADAIVATVRAPLVVLDEKLHVLRANRGFYETFTVSPELTEGRLLFDLGERQWDIPRLRDLLEEVVPLHTTFENFEVTHDFPGLGPRTMLLNARRIEDGAGRASRILLAIEDVTERRRAEAERENRLSIAERGRAEAEGLGDLLQRVQTITDMALLKLSFDDLLREILERVRHALGGDTAVILLRRLHEADEEADGEMLYARAAIGLDEESRARVGVPIGTGFAGRVAAEQRPVILDEVDYAQVVSPYIREKGLRSLVGVPLLTEGGLLGVLHVGSVQPRKFSQKDVEILMLAAERIAHAVEVAARRESEHRARTAAEAANRAKDEFLALLSHELRNPLSAVRNAITSARLDPSARGRALEIAGRQSEHLTRLVDDLLDVARITQGKIRLRRERVSLRDAAARAIESARSFVDGRGHILSMISSDEGVVDADPARLEQIIENLVTNAAKYTPPGGRIDIEIEQFGDKAILRVRDNGIGISAEMLPRVFDLFSQGDARLDHGYGGLGIGLTVVRRLVELHGGQIEARSEGPGRGSEFIVRLPAVPVSEGDEPAGRPSSEIVPSARVLVVEDNPDAAESLQMLLELFGHRVRVVHDGPAAIDAVRAEAPDLALVDIGLPGMNGYEVARHLREQPGLERTTLVALSGYGRDEDKQRAIAAGFHLHLTKPIDADRLQALLADLQPRRAGDSG